MQQSEWKGQRPQRFDGGRKHMNSVNQLGPNMQPTLTTIGQVGIRTFQPIYSQERGFKAHLKVYPEKYHEATKQIELRGKKYVQLGEQGDRTRPQKLHIAGGQQANSQFVNRGIKSLAGSTGMSNTQYGVETKMQRKARIDGYEEQRNRITTSNLGDKPYKYPQYSVNFYQQGGLVIGSTFRPLPAAKFGQNKKFSILTKPNWDVVVKMQQVAQDKRVVNAVDEWQQTILKQANPNWNDPDTFFERLQAKKQIKDVKKAGKK